eukprot:g7721.t1
MNDSNLDDASEDTSAVFERPKSRLPRLPQTSKPIEFEANESLTVKAPPKGSLSTEGKMSTHALSVRQYLESSVVPVLMKGLTNLVRERPEDPVEYLAAFLVNNNPNNNTTRSGEDEIDA